MIPPTALLAGGEEGEAEGTKVEQRETFRATMAWAGLTFDQTTRVVRALKAATLDDFIDSVAPRDLRDGNLERVWYYERFTLVVSVVQQFDEVLERLMKVVIDLNEFESCLQKCEYERNAEGAKPANARLVT